MRIKISLLILSSSLFGGDFVNLYTKISNSYKMKALNYDIKAKKLQIKQAKNNYLPTINTSLSHEIYGDKEMYESNTTNDYYDHDVINKFSIKLSQNIVNYQITPLIKDARLNYELSKINKNDNLQKELQKLYSSYLDVITQKELLKFYQQKLTNLKTIINNLKEKANLNYATPIDVLKAKEKYLQTLSKYNQALFKIKINSFLIEKSISSSLVINETLKKDILNPSLPKYSIEKNPNLKTFLIKTKIAKNKIKQKQTKSYPKLTLSAYYNLYQHTSYNEREYSLSLNIDLPIFDKSITTDKEISTINSQKEFYNYLDKKNSLLISFNKITNQFDYLKLLLQEDYENLKLAEELKQQNMLSYKNKLIDKTKYLQQLNKIVDYKIKILNDKSQLAKLYISFLYITGNLNKKEIKRVKEIFLN